jgi:hypothetical protein
VFAIIRITRAERTIVEKAAKTAVKAVKVLVKLGKTITKMTTSKRKAAEIEITSKDNNNSNKIKESEIIYIHKADITPKIKRNICLAKKKLEIKVSFFRGKIKQI